MNFDKYAAQATAFVQDVQQELGLEDFDRAGRILRAVLYALRARLTPEESFKLLAQMPMFIKALYVDGWRVSESPDASIREVSDLVEEVQRQAGSHPPTELVGSDNTRKTTRCVLHVLKRHISAGERDDVAADLPAQLESFWVAA